MSATAIQSFYDFKRRYPISFTDTSSFLGSGTYGRVLKVEDQIETEWVAVKISEYKGSDDKSLKAEVELAQKVARHTNIARYDTCYRLETDMGICDFAIMKYYPDGNLADLMKAKDLSFHQIKDLAKGILLGLKHLHTHRIVHRDFKPANILISRDNKGTLIPKIADFGLSKLVSRDEIDSSDFDLSDGRGTPSYKAPEQIEGGRVSFNLDLWAYGVILYEMLTGEKPFIADNDYGSESNTRREVELKIVTASLPTKLQSVDEPFQSIIKRCLIKDIHKRVRREDELLELLELGEHTDIRPDTASLANYSEKKTELPFQSPKKQVFEQLPTEEATDLLIKSPSSANHHQVTHSPKNENRSLMLIFGCLGILITLVSAYFLLKPNLTSVRPMLSKDSSISSIALPPKTTTPEATTPVTTTEKSLIQAQYQKALRKSKSALATQSWDDALAFAKQALQLKPRDQAANAAKVAAEKGKEKEAIAIEEETSQRIIENEKNKAQTDYVELLNKGAALISSSNNKTAAMAIFTQAQSLAAKFNLSTERAQALYNSYFSKGNRIFESEEYEGAKAWYLVAQSLINTPEVQKKIKQCNSNL
jgi:eukaryotic-like serine/threonine-protein kinase